MIFGVGIPGSVFTEKKKRCSLKEWEAIKKNMSKKKIQPPVEGEKQKLIEIPNCLWKFF